MKPFYVKRQPEHTNLQIAELFNLAQKAGANLHDGVEDINDCKYPDEPSIWEYYGVDYDNETMFYDLPVNFGGHAEELTYEQATDYLNSLLPKDCITKGQLVEALAAVANSIECGDAQSILTFIEGLQK